MMSRDAWGLDGSLAEGDEGVGGVVLRYWRLTNITMYMGILYFPLSVARIIPGPIVSAFVQPTL